MGSAINMFVRGVVSAVNSLGKLQLLQLRLLWRETKDNVEHFEPFGFTSHPLPGAEHVTVFMDGDRSHGITLVVTDRRYRLQGLPAGGVALYDSAGACVVLSADHRIKVKADTKVLIDSPDVEITGSLKVGQNIVADGDISDHTNKKMSTMRQIYDGHTHPIPGGGATNAPNQQQG